MKKMNVAQAVRNLSVLEPTVLADKVYAFTAKLDEAVKVKPKGSKKEEPLEDKDLAALVEAAGLLAALKTTVEAALAKVREEIEALEPQLGTFKGTYGKVTVLETDRIEITDPVKLARTVGLERFLEAVTIRPTKKVLSFNGRKTKELIKVEKIRSLRIGKA